MVLPMVAKAESVYIVYIDGIYYNLNFESNNAEVAFHSYFSYSGDIVIPSTVTYEDVEYDVTGIRKEAFKYNRELTSIIIPNSVKTIGSGAFDECTGLTSITIPNSVTSLEYNLFRDCTGLTSITIPNSVTNIGAYAFENCTGLTSITIPNSVTSIAGAAFHGCTGLTSITIPNSVTTIGNSAFNGCTGLTSITIPKNVTNIEPSVFSGCSGLNSIVVESGNPTYDSRDNCNAIIETESNTLISVCNNTVIPNSVTTIGDHAFSGCSNLTSITIPNSVTTIGDDAFNGCTGLTSITIPNSVTTIGYSAFCNCSNLTSITIPNSVTTIDDYAFEHCTNLTSIAIPNSVTTIGNAAFMHCSCLTSICIPNSVTKIGTGVLAMCYDLTSVVVESGNPTYDSRDNCNAIIETTNNTLISGCKNTIIPNSVTTIGDWAFFYCAYLTSITIPNNVTIIGESAFFHCGLEKLIIGSNVKNIGVSSFSGCYKLSNIYCYCESVLTIESHTFETYVQGGSTLHVPSSLIETYKATSPWCYFDNIVALTDDDPKPTRINRVSTNFNKIGVYDLNGQERQTIRKGLNIIKMGNDTTKKVLIK